MTNIRTSRSKIFGRIAFWKILLTSKNRWCSPFLMARTSNLFKSNFKRLFTKKIYGDCFWNFLFLKRRSEEKISNVPGLESLWRMDDWNWRETAIPKYKIFCKLLMWLYDNLACAIFLVTLNNFPQYFSTKFCERRKIDFLF